MTEQPDVNCDDILDLIPDYAFGLTSAAETRHVQAHLADCPAAAQALADFKSLQAQMRVEVAPQRPPPSLETRLFAAIRKDASPVSQTRQGSGRRAWWLIAAACVVLALVNGYWLGQVQDLRREKAALEAQLAVWQPSDGSVPLVLSSAQGLQWARLPAVQADSKAAAFVMWSGESSKVGVLCAWALPSSAAGQRYQVVLSNAAGDERLGTFMVDAAGRGALLFYTDEPLSAYQGAQMQLLPENAPAEAVVVGQL